MPLLPRQLALPALILIGLLSTGCVQRTIMITSEPPGAAVWLNDVPLGPTPVESEFKFYGTYDVRLRLDGYEPVTTSRDAAAPFYEYPVVDLFAAPFPVHNRIAWHFKLDPLPELQDRPAAEKALTDRARQARADTLPGVPQAPNPEKPVP